MSIYTERDVQELHETIGTYRRDVVHLTLLLNAIISQTEPGRGGGGDGHLYVWSRDGLRQIPDGLEKAIKEAKAYLGLDK